MPTGDPILDALRDLPYGEPVGSVSWVEGSRDVIFTSGSRMADFTFMSTGTVISSSIIDDPVSVNENPPFPGWDSATQVVRFVDENGIIGVAAGYEELAICDDLELDPEDFNMRLAEIVVDARAGVTHRAVRTSVRIKEMETEIKLLTAELLRLYGLYGVSPGDASPPPGVSPPYTEKMWGKRPPAMPVGWSKGSVVGPEAGGIAASFDDLFREGLAREAGEYTAHNDNVDAISMSVGAMIRKAIGKGFGVGG